MIEVTKFGGLRLVVNADHIECVEAQPETALILNNGKRIVVLEQLEIVVERIITYQRLIRGEHRPRTHVVEGVDGHGVVNESARSV